MTRDCSATRTSSTRFAIPSWRRTAFNERGHQGSTLMTSIRHNEHSGPIAYLTGKIGPNAVGSCSPNWPEESHAE